MTENYKLDMTMMFAVHDALRRELGRLARVSARADADPRRLLASAAGWGVFKQFLTVHHTAEDMTVWPVMETALAGRIDDLELLHALESEHAAIDPLLVAIDEAIADLNGGPERLGDLLDALETRLTSHLKHEEGDGLRLIDLTLTQEQWAAFSADHRERIGADSKRYLPWLLDDASSATVEGILGKMPPNFVEMYENEWRKAYIESNLWGAALA